MSEETGSVNKLGGIWMQLDAIIHRENINNIWENRGEYSKMAPRKKEKLKLRSKTVLLCHPHLYEFVLFRLIIHSFTYYTAKILKIYLGKCGR